MDDEWSELNHIWSDRVHILVVDAKENKNVIFHGVLDESIDEAFPLIEDEEAELEIECSFTEVLLELSILEETEEE